MATVEVGLIQGSLLVCRHNCRRSFGSFGEIALKFVYLQSICLFSPLTVLEYCQDFGWLAS